MYGLVHSAIFFSGAAVARGTFVSPLSSTALPLARGGIVHHIPRHRLKSPSKSPGITLSNEHISFKKPTKSLSKKAETTLGIVLGLSALATNAAVAHAAKNAVASTASASNIILPTTPTLILASVLPTLLGFYKSEYGVSYGYGTAIAASSYLVLSSIATATGVQLIPTGPFEPSTILRAIQSFATNMKSLISTSLPAFHAASLLFYGTRLDLFLLYRECCLPRFREMRERIEERAKKQGSRIKRLPFLASCAFLYFCMMCPLLVTSQVCAGLAMFSGIKTGLSCTGSLVFLEQALKLFVFLTLSGFLLGAVGDMTKSIGKLTKGEDALITGGVFRFFRHPNYTGEVIGWVSSCLAAFTAVAWKVAKGGANGLVLWKTMIPHLIMSVMGAIGISFVLGTATAGLEYRQNEKYGETEEYKQWVKTSWVGFTMGQRKVDNGKNQGSAEKEENNAQE
ncbi:hypothetical protein HJC23_009423 [Cyclotella cryptica]|uniref:Steroid 5-alpha reductase C-terminal domain-containing protein n=1 Tax=Cyclotella cryptica TaxID=29204 RepID=A0ABD3PXH5_9STRA